MTCPRVERRPLQLPKKDSKPLESDKNEGQTVEYVVKAIPREELGSPENIAEALGVPLDSNEQADVQEKLEAKEADSSTIDPTNVQEKDGEEAEKQNKTEKEIPSFR